MTAAAFPAITFLNHPVVMKGELVMRSSMAKSGILFVVALAAAPAQRDARVGDPPLREALAGYFLVGAAINARLIQAEDSLGTAIVTRQFNSVTPENALKWERVHPEPGRYEFAVPDRYVEFGERRGMFVVGHTLVWHKQTPRWVFRDASGNPVSREELVNRMRDHIRTVVGRYRGRVDGWDVVNEALDEDGSLRQSPWLEILGEEYVGLAFRFAHEADPDAQLYYNDYSLESPAKREGALKLIAALRNQGVPITGVGLQDHIHLHTPSTAQMDTAIVAFATLGVRVMITELDVDVLPSATRNQGGEITRGAAIRSQLDPYVDGLPDSVQQALATRYHDVFAVYLKHHDVIDRVTFWGVTDRSSWKNNWPVRGRTNYPLLFGRDGHPKPAFHAVVRAAREAGAARRE